MSKKLDEKTLKKEFEIRLKLHSITKMLKLYDKISLIFLICETPQSGIKIMQNLFSETDKKTQDNLFFNWLLNQNLFKWKDWEGTFAEFLAIIQHFHSAKVLGFTKAELIEKFKPKNHFVNYNVSLIRKVLYNLCETLTQKKCQKLISDVNNLCNVKEFEESELKLKYFEYQLLLWSENNVIDLNENNEINIDILLQFLKELDLNNFVTDIEIVVEKVKCQVMRAKALCNQDQSPLEFYSIDKDEIGFCVIINQKKFSNPALSTRWGTEKDVERLIEVFTRFNFTIKVHSNLKFEKLVTTLGHYANSVKKSHSVFILIILSHGSENVIYTSDCQPVDINTIEMIFQAEICPSLIGKPKIFIVQSCQGEKWQQVLERNDESNIVCDSPFCSEDTRQMIKGPQKGDSLLAWSTVQGFASFRDKLYGSWYIQELCKELWRFGDLFDLVEILTRVNNNLRNKTYNEQFMVPSLLSSLRAKIKFPISEENDKKAKKLLLERLYFEKYFKEFIKSYSSIILTNLIKN